MSLQDIQSAQSSLQRGLQAGKEAYDTSDASMGASQRAYNYLMGGASFKNPYLNYADTDGSTPTMPSTENIGDNHWEYDPLTKAWRLVAGKGATAEAPKSVADVNAQYQKLSGSSSGAPFGYDSNGDRLTTPKTNLTDAEWDAVKQMRDEKGFFNPYEIANIKAAGSVLFGGIAGIPTAMKQAAIARNELDNAIAHSPTGAYQPSYVPSGMTSDIGTPAWTEAVNQTANARLLRQGATGTEDTPSSTGSSYTFTSGTGTDYGRAADAMGAPTREQAAAQDTSFADSMRSYESAPAPTATPSDSDAVGGYYTNGKFNQRPTQNYAAGGLGSLGSYSDGGQLLRGPGDGVSDGIPALIGGNQPARLAEGEFVLPARIVSELGNGSTEAGAKKLYAMMDRIEKAQRKAKRGKDSNADKYLPA